MPNRIYFEKQMIAQVSAPAESTARAKARKETGPSPPERSGGGIFSPRVVKIPLKYDPAAWKKLRQMAYVCAHYGNELLSAQYVQAKTNGKEVREPRAAELMPYTDFNDRLSSYCRDAVGREVIGIWRRTGRDVLTGKRSLATFSADRALVVRDRGIKIFRAKGRYWIRLAVEPKSIGQPADLAVSNKALAMDPYRKLLMRRLDAGAYDVVKATAIFKRGRMKLLLTYNRPLNKEIENGVEAEVGPVEDGICAWVRCAGRSYGITDSLARIAELKNKYEAIRHRLQIVNTNRNRRREWRLRFLGAASFEQAVQGPLHRLSREIVNFAFSNGAKSLMWKIEHDGALPWDTLRQMAEYKAAECGMTFSQTVKKNKQAKDLRNTDNGDNGKASGNLSEKKP